LYTDVTGLFTETQKREQLPGRGRVTATGTTHITTAHTPNPEPLLCLHVTTTHTLHTCIEDSPILPRVAVVGVQAYARGRAVAEFTPNMLQVI
jgi:hypothetical protein